MQRLVILVFAIVSYLMALGSLVYAMGFVANIGVPKSIDAAPTMAFWPALAINVLLLGIFAVQHSVMARPAFKRRLARIFPEAAGRSLFVIGSAMALFTLFYFWQPLGGQIWRVDNPLGVAALYGVQALGWGIVLLSSFLINHFELFGLQQAWINFRRRAPGQPKFVTPWLYKLVRHPLYFGMLLAFWSAPTMTVTHLVFAAMTTAYIFFGAKLEERDLEDELGEAYAQYKRQVPMIVPTGRQVTLADNVTISA